MKKGVLIIFVAIALLFFIGSIKAINVTNINFTNSITDTTKNIANTISIKEGNITSEITNESVTITGEVTGETVTGKPTQPLRMNITVTNHPPNITSYYPLNLILNVLGTYSLYFNVTAQDPDGAIPNIFWYADNSLKNYNISNYSEFTYSFGCGISGSHTVKIIATDNIYYDLNNFIQWNLTVNYTECPSVPTVPTGGGGGGAGITPACAQEWECESWGNCQNLEKSLKDGILFGEDYRVIKNKCSLFNWDEKYCGFQMRKCFDYSNCNMTGKEKLEMQECYYTERPSCDDGIKNCHDGACEVLIDCGGPCLPCPSCSDRIKNQGEEGVDCGGPCPPCALEKPLAALIKKPLNYILIIISIILAILIFVKTVRVIKLREKIKKIKKIKLRYFLFVFIIILIITFFYFYTKFEVGDFVYKKDKGTILIGEIKNRSIILEPLVEWQDGSYTKEFVLNIGKINYLSEEEIRYALQMSNVKELSLYSWDERGEAVDRRIPIRTIKELSNYTIRIGEESCRPRFICEGWSGCRVNYDFTNMVSGELTSGRRYKLCVDYEGCMSDFFYSEKCGIKESVTIKETITKGRIYVELYDKTNALIFKITKEELAKLKKLYIEIVV